MDEQSAKITGLGNKKKWIGASILGVVFIMVAGLLFVMLNSSPVGAFKKAIRDNQGREAKQIYMESIQGDPAKVKRIEEFLDKETTKTTQAFVKGTMEYNDAYRRLQAIQLTGLLSSVVTSAQATVEDLKGSRAAFKNGEDLVESNNLYEAMAELNKVNISDTDYYIKAQKRIGEIDKKVELSKTNPEMSVTHTELLFNKSKVASFSASVQNNTDKQVVGYVVGWIGYFTDKETGYAQYSFLQEGKSSQAIPPGESYGKYAGWELGTLDKAAISPDYIACVKEVEFADGTRWDNPYYPFWAEEYEGNWLKLDPK